MALGEAVIQFVGTVTADPELRFTPSGHAVVSMTVAVNGRKLNKNTNTWENSSATFFRCSAWRQMAENIAESIQKGTRVAVTGNITQREYETKQGEKRTVFDVQMDTCAPDLTFATAKISKLNRGGTSGGGGQTSGGSFAGGVADDPWSAPSGGGGFSSEPPF